MASSEFDFVNDPAAGSWPQPSGATGRGRRGKEQPSRVPFIGIQFRCCRCYGRIYRNAARTAYCGRCPKCGKPISLPIGSGGTETRFFTAG